MIIQPKLEIQRGVEWTSQVVLVVKNPPANAGDIRDCGFDPCFGKIPGRRAWQPTPVLLPGESHGQRSLAAVHSVTELDMTEVTVHACTQGPEARTVNRHKPQGREKLQRRFRGWMPHGNAEPVFLSLWVLSFCFSNKPKIYIFYVKLINF